jgi:hypothetical protein
MGTPQHQEMSHSTWSGRASLLAIRQDVEANGAGNTRDWFPSLKVYNTRERGITAHDPFSATGR